MAAALKRRIARALPPDLAQLVRRAAQLRGTMSAADYVAAVNAMMEEEP